MHNVCLQKSINEQLCIPLGKNLPVFAAEVVCLDVRELPNCRACGALNEKNGVSESLEMRFSITAQANTSGMVLASVQQLDDVVPANSVLLWAHENASSMSGSTGAWDFTALMQIQDILFFQDILFPQPTHLTNKQTAIVPLLSFLIYCGPHISAEVEQDQGEVRGMSSH